MDPRIRIRIHIKMSWIRNTALFKLFLQVEEREGVFYSLESGHKLEWHSEENWCFKLSSQRENILNWLTRGEKSPVQPVQFLPQVREQAEQPEGE
jgi:hypothetical protein